MFSMTCMIWLLLANTGCFCTKLYLDGNKTSFPFNRILEQMEGEIEDLGKKWEIIYVFTDISEGNSNTAIGTITIQSLTSSNIFTTKKLENGTEN